MLLRIAYMMIAGLMLFLANSGAYAGSNSGCCHVQQASQSDYAFSSASDDHTVDLRIHEITSVEGPLFQQEKKIQQKCCCGSRFVNQQTYFRHLVELCNEMPTEPLSNNYPHSLAFLCIFRH